MKYIVSYQPTTKRGASTTPIKIILNGLGPVAHLTPVDARELAAALLKQADDIDASTTTYGAETRNRPGPDAPYYPVTRADGRVVRVSVPPSDND